MEASQQPGQGEQQGEGGAADSQQNPTTDSNLQTPQPDQQVPSEADRQAAAEASGTEQAPNPGQAAPPVEQAPVERPDQVEEAAQRESDLEAQQREHNARSGGGEVREGEVAQQRQEHNEIASSEGAQDQA
jgi:hypothetical protein